MSIAVETSPARTTVRNTRVAFGVCALLVLGVVAWAYAKMLAVLAGEWNRDPNYSVGMIVPFAAIWLLWSDRAKLARLELRPAWSGAIIILLAQAIRLFGLDRMLESLERYSLILTLVGLVVLLGGWPLFHQVKYVLALLLLMIPFPGYLHNRLSSPLQTLSTSGAVATLELIGISIDQQGNQLYLNGRVPIAIAEACSGLRMLTAFIFISAVFAYITRRPAWMKVVLLLSSVPIAIITNIIRLVATAMLFLWTNDTLANRFFHDFAGWTMMPLAVGMLWLELWILDKLDADGKEKPKIEMAR